MNEKQLINRFIQFLSENKGYPTESVASELSISSRNDKDVRFYVDLALLDLDSNEYIGLIEFKSKLDEKAKKNSRDQVLRYRDVLGVHSAPLFLVTPLGEESFQIHRLENDEVWIPISLDDFPAYKTLSSQRKAEEKIWKDQKERYVRKRKQLLSYWTLSSAILGIIVSVLSVFFLQDEFTKKGQPIIIQDSCCDSLQTQIDNLKKENLVLSKRDTVKTKIDTSLTYKKLDAKIQRLEFSISSDPENVLTRIEFQNRLRWLEKELGHLKETKDLKIESIESQLNIIFSIIIGIFLALISTMIGVVVAFGRK